MLRGICFCIFFAMWAFFAMADELISTRCQANCLHQMDVRYRQDAEMRRKLKHHIVTLCKEDANCSSCSHPCREQFTTTDNCQSICVNTEHPESCQKSCDFLQKIYTEKPGDCPKPEKFTNYECTAECHLDGDCAETEKCCTVGCSRKCKKPTESGLRLLPIPDDISVQERKRKRSAVVRWSVRDMSSHEESSNANVYVVQWRWSVHQKEETMTEWQTIVVKNKMYAILKHLLSPGRFYQFRVAAVNQHGSRGFSTPSEPFRLSKEARAPSAPRHTSLGETKLINGKWSQFVYWTSPHSDLPIKNYVVSWAASNPSEADTFEEQMRRMAVVDTQRQAKRDLDNEEGLWEIIGDRHSIVTPSHVTQAEITNLEPGAVYIVEVHAVVDSSDGELQGEKGVVFIRTGKVGRSAETSQESREVATSSEGVTSSSEVDRPSSEEITSEPAQTPTLLPPLHDVPTQPEAMREMKKKHEIQAQIPFYDQSLQTTINWLDTPSCSPQRNTFIVKTRKIECDGSTVSSHWRSASVSECQLILDDLTFKCRYAVQVFVEEETEPSVEGSFTTASCEATAGTSSDVCEEDGGPLSCQQTATTAYCIWSRMRADRGDIVIGYRVVVSSPTRDLNNITILPPHQREIDLEGLSPGSMYTVQVQAISSRGLGRSEQYTFHTNFEQRHFGDEHIALFPGGEIVELPLESGSSAITCLISIFVIALLL